jgi:ABC-2 type transport system permease protein
MSVAQTARDHRVTLTRALRSEGIKLAGLRATKWLIGAALVAPFLITLIWASAASGPVDAAAVLDTATPSSFATFIILILVGIMTATSDYENNAAVQTYSVVPARTPVVLAKYTLVAAIALAVSLVTSAGTFALADVLRGGGVAAWSPEAIRVLLDLALAETCGALIGVAAGLMVRSSIGALGVILGFFYLVPLILSLIPVDVMNLIGKSIPGASLTTLVSLTSAEGQLDPLTLTVTTVLWTAVWLVVAAIAVKRRNV